MSGPGRKSLHTNEARNNIYYSIEQNNQIRVLNCIILEVLGSHNPKSFYLEDVVIDMGLEFILFCKENFQIYRYLYNENEDTLRTIYGQDSNITGREFIVYSISYNENDVYLGKHRWGTSYETKTQDQFEQGYVSLAIIGGIKPDLDFQSQAYKKNLTSGRGKTWRPIWVQKL